MDGEKERGETVIDTERKKEEIIGWIDRERRRERERRKKS